MRVIHGSWLIEIERNCCRTILRLLGYDFTAVALLNDQPGVVGVKIRPISKPAEADIRNEFVHAATNGESESLPLKLALRSEPILIGIRYLNIGQKDLLVIPCPPKYERPCTGDRVTLEVRSELGAAKGRRSWKTYIIHFPGDGLDRESIHEVLDYDS